MSCLKKPVIPLLLGKGGITVSGGEPLLQIDFLTEFFKKAKKEGINTTLDTSGNPYTEEGHGIRNCRS